MTDKSLDRTRLLQNSLGQTAPRGKKGTWSEWPTAMP